MLSPENCPPLNHPTITEDVGLRGNYGTHTLRKIWGYHARKNGVEPALIMHNLNF